MIPVITYHGVADIASPVFTAPQVFEGHLAALAKAGCQTVTLAEALAALRGEGALPEKAVVLCFDDGYASVAEVAWPLLRAYGFSATVFWVSGWPDNHWPSQPPGIPRLPLLTAAQVARLAAEGCEFGAHTRTHPVLPRLNDAELEAELAESQAAVQRASGQPARLFAYPYGAFDSRVMAAARRCFDGAVSTRLGFATRHSDPYALERIDAYYLTPLLIAHLHDPLLARYFAVRQLLRTVRRFVRPDYAA